jgi:hypothetical protein
MLLTSNPINLFYTPGHIDPRDWESHTDAAKKMINENDRIINSPDNLGKMIRMTSTLNTMTDNITSSFLKQYYHALRDTINSWDYIPEKGRRLTPIAWIGPNHTSRLPMYARDDMVSILNIRPELIPNDNIPKIKGNGKNNERVILNGDILR